MYGKFGLGMKSVFHLCESFFYVASDGSTIYSDILNPWCGERLECSDMHRQWEEVTSRDRDCLVAVAHDQPESTRHGNWFLLWIPLRTHSHIPRVEKRRLAAIIERYPGEDPGQDLDFFNDPGTEQRIGALLPLLRNLRQVRFAGVATRESFTVVMDSEPSGQRLDHTTDGVELTGSVRDSRSRADQLQFLVRQRVPGNVEPFTTLRNAQSWPASIVDAGTGTRETVPDKAVAEAAVMFAHAEGRGGRLDLQWAVFLPADEQRFKYLADIPNSSREYRVVLHGQFFVDAGRRGIADMETLDQPCGEINPGAAQHDVLRQWNQSLAQETVLPELLPALERYVTSARLKDDETAALTDALAHCAATGDSGSRVEFFNAFRRYVCARFAWIRRLTPGGSTWTLVEPALSPVLPLPTPPVRDPKQPWRALPGLQRIEHCAFTDANAPRLSNGVAIWEAERLIAALEGIGAQTLRSEGDLEYLVRFLEMEAPRYVQNAQVQGVLVSLLRKALQDVGLSEVRRHRSIFKRLAGALAPDRLLPLGPQHRQARSLLTEEVFSSLLAVQTHALPLPADLAPDGASGTGHMRQEDLGLWLQALAGLQSVAGSVMTGVLDAAEWIIRAAGDDQAHIDLVRQYRRLKVLRALEGARREFVCVSLDDLMQAQARGWLFKVGDSSDKLGCVPILAAALPQARLLVVSRLVAGLVEAAQHPEITGRLPVTDNQTALLRAVGLSPVTPALGGVKERGRLLQVAGGQADFAEEAVRRGTRYLLHGDPLHYDKRSETLWKDPGGGNSLWVRLWRMVHDQPWTVLDKALCQSIPDSHSEALGIQAVDESSVKQKLRACQELSRVDAQQFTAGEIDLILGRVQDHATWLRLPLHRTFEGAYCAAERRCFLGNSPALPPGVGNDILFIRPSDDTDHQRQQRDFLRPWTALAAVEVVLASTEPAQHWRYLLDLLGEQKWHADQLPPAWLNVRWLPLAAGSPINLDSLIRLDQLQSDIRELARQCDYVYASVLDLAPEVQGHQAFARLQEQVKDGAEALPVLGLMMQVVGLAVGRAVYIEPALMRPPLQRLAALQSLPAWRILEAAAAATSIDAMERCLLPEVATQLPLPLCMQVLDEITEGRASSETRNMYRVYLQEWRRSSDSESELRDALARLRLPSAAGRWTAAAELVIGVSGVAPTCLLDESLREPLVGIMVDNDINLAPDAPDESMPSPEANSAPLGPALEAYFEALATSSVRPAVGAVIGLFGHEMAPLARRWLEPIAYEDYLDKLNWIDPGREDGFDHRRRWMGDRTLEQALKTLKLRVQVVEGSHVTADSLTGTTVQVPLQPAEQLQTLYIKSDGWRGYSGRVLLHPATALLGMDHQRQRDVLMRSAESMLKRLYNQPHANLSALFDLFEDADQVTLDVARSLVLEGLPQSLRTLPGIKKSAALGTALDDLAQARRNAASARYAKRSSTNTDKALDVAREALVGLVEQDVEVQAVILSGFRERVAHNQYELASIPFEIFQNADDAVAELQQLQREDGRAEFSLDAIGCFVMHRDGCTLRFAHWGRPVNYTGRGACSNPDFASDLERMLMLGASAKDDQNNVTGKFGLGFKSVLLASQRPRVWSGDLCFEVVAGCLPVKWLPEAPTRTFQQEAFGATARQLRTTVIELPLDDGVVGDDVAARFTALAGLQPVLARQIRCVIAGTQQHEWSPTTLLHSSTHGVVVETGSVSLPLRKGSLRCGLLVLRSGRGTAVLRLNSDGIQLFDPDARPAVPALWVTAPTRGTPARGVLVNAAFQIDTGRAALAQSKTASAANTALADALARDFAPAVVMLHERTHGDWNGLRAQLGLHDGITPAQFWHGFWDALLGEQPGADAASDVKLVNGFACTLLRLVVERTGVVSNGLDRAAAALVDAKRLRLSVSLRYLGRVLDPLGRWPAFLALFPRDSWCADTVCDWLTRAGLTADARIPDLDRTQVLSALPDMQLAAADLPYLADVLQAWPQQNGEQQRWKLDLMEVQLQSRGGAWRSPRLMLRGAERDAELIQQFAPDTAVLDPAYKATAGVLASLEGFLAPWQPDQMTLAHWCLKANSTEARVAVINWLERHLSDTVIVHLGARRHEGDWLFDLTEDSPYLAELPKPAARLLLFKLGLCWEEEASPPPPARTMAFDLEAIQGWWSEHGNRWLRKFDQQFWPAHIDKAMLRQDDPPDRSAWMTLFALGLLRSVGRVTDDQHRGFLEFLDRKGWWTTICEVDPHEGAAAWMNILREYGEGQQVDTSFELWMNSFPRLYRVARWLNTYVHLFTTLDWRDSQRAHCLLTPAADPSLAGSGIDAPTLSGMLRLGRHLVVRELLRVQVLSSETAKELAFAPRSAVVALMAELGHTVSSSQDIYEVLKAELGEEDATFGGAYDIPLQLIATHARARDEVCDYAAGVTDDDGEDMEELVGQDPSELQLGEEMP